MTHKPTFHSFPNVWGYKDPFVQDHCFEIEKQVKKYWIVKHMFLLYIQNEQASIKLACITLLNCVAAFCGTMYWVRINIFILFWDFMFMGSTRIEYCGVFGKQLQTHSFLIAASFFEKRPTSSCLVMLCAPSLKSHSDQYCIGMVAVP